jgi:hypothetical protein
MPTPKVCKNAYLLRHFVLKTLILPRQARNKRRLILPRQARDKRRDNSKQQRVFLQDYCVPDSTPPPPPPPPPAGMMETAPIGEMAALLIPPVRRHEPRTPVAINALAGADGTFVLDFQVNQAMQCSLKIETVRTNALSGAVLTFKNDRFSKTCSGQTLEMLTKKEWRFP